MEGSPGLSWRFEGGVQLGESGMRGSKMPAAHLRCPLGLDLADDPLPLVKGEPATLGRSDEPRPAVRRVDLALQVSEGLQIGHQLRGGGHAEPALPREPGEPDAVTIQVSQDRQVCPPKVGEAPLGGSREQLVVETAQQSDQQHAEPWKSTRRHCPP